MFSTATENGLKNWGKSVSQKAVKSAQKQYDIWRKSIGADATPKTLAKYYDMKYNDKKTYNLLKGYAFAVDKGCISPLVGFDLYKDTAYAIEKELIGITTKDGKRIENYTTHFIDRVIGQTDEPHKGMREGVKIDDIKDALLNPIEISVPYFKNTRDGKNDMRCTYYNNKCSVAYSISDKILIQTNPI